jgi:hypothetical protein
MTKSFKSERKEAIEYIKLSKDDDFICDLLKKLISNESIFIDNKEIILSQEERLDFLHSINEYNYYCKNKIIRSKIIDKRIKSYTYALKDTSMKDSTHCLDAFTSPQVRKILF